MLPHLFAVSRGGLVPRVRGGFLAYAPALLPGCEPLRYVYKALCDLDHLLGEAGPDSSPTRYTLRVGGTTVRYFPAARVAIIFAKTPSEAEAVLRSVDHHNSSRAILYIEQNAHLDIDWALSTRRFFSESYALPICDTDGAKGKTAYSPPPRRRHVCIQIGELFNIGGMGGPWTSPADVAGGYRRLGAGRIHVFTPFFVSSPVP